MPDEFDRFVVAMNKRGQEVLDGVSRVKGKAFRTVAEHVVLNTPVLTGLARGNWQATVEAPTVVAVERMDPSGVTVIAEAAGVAARAKPGQTLFLANNLPYIGALNEGSSPQQPEPGFVERAVAAGEAEAETEGARVFKV